MANHITMAILDKLKNSAKWLLMIFSVISPLIVVGYFEKAYSIPYVVSYSLLFPLFFVVVYGWNWRVMSNINRETSLVLTIPFVIYGIIVCIDFYIFDLFEPDPIWFVIALLPSLIFYYFRSKYLMNLGDISGVNEGTMNDNVSTPTEDDFARASRKMAEHSERESELKNDILSKVPEEIPTHDIWLSLSDKLCTVNYIFPTDTDLNNYKGSARETIENLIADSVTDIEIVSVNVVYHSHEHVQKYYSGNYYQYFR